MLSDVGWDRKRGEDGRTFAERVRALRNARGWSQAELAERVTGNRRATTALAWEKGAAPAVDTAVTLARVLEVDLHYLLFGEARPLAAADAEQRVADAEHRLDVIRRLADRAVPLAQALAPDGDAGFHRAVDQALGPLEEGQAETPQPSPPVRKAGGGGGGSS